MLCTRCGGRTVQKMVEVDKTWKGRRITFRGVEAMVCAECGEQAVGAEEAAMMEALIEETFSHADYPRIVEIGYREMKC